MSNSSTSTENSYSVKTHYHQRKRSLNQPTFVNRSEANAGRNNRSHFAKFLHMKRLGRRSSVKERNISVPVVPIKVYNKRESRFAALLSVFAITECLCGFVLPICDAFIMTGSWTKLAVSHKYYLEIFLIAQYSWAILALAYLQMLIHLGTKKMCKSNSLEWKPSDTSSQIIFNEQGDALQAPLNNYTPIRPFSHGTRNSNVRVQDNPLTWHTEGMNLYMRLGAVGFGLGVMIHDGFNLSSVWEIAEPVCHSELWIPKHIIRLIWVLWQTYFIFKYHRVIMHAHTASVRLSYTHLATVNLCHWLKVVISEVTRTLNNPSSQVDSNGYTACANQSNADVHDRVRRSIDRPLVNETIVNNTTVHATNFNSIQHVCHSYLGAILTPFLFPLTIEYSLIAGSFFFKMLKRLDLALPKHRLLVHQQSMKHRISLDLQLRSPITKMSPQTNGNSSNEDSAKIPLKQKQICNCQKHVKYRQVMGCKIFLPLNTSANGAAVDIPGDEHQSIVKNLPASHEVHCHRSHSGLFLGIMLLAASIIGIVLFILRTRAGFVEYATFIYQQSKVILSSVCLLACVMAIIQTRNLKFRPLKHGESFEYNLLTIGLIGCIAYHLFLFLPAIEMVIFIALEESANDKSDWRVSDLGRLTTIAFINRNIPYTALVYMVKSILEIFQALLQFFFILEISARGPCCMNQAMIKPGRSIIVFLLIGNLALWMMNTFEVRGAETQLLLHRKYYGVRSWSVITCCFMPLIIFFRFHSTVCLAELWSKLYKL